MSAPRAPDGRPWHPEELARDAVTIAELAEQYDADPTTPAVTEPLELHELAEEDDAPDPGDPRGRRVSLAQPRAVAFRVVEMRAIMRIYRDTFGGQVAEAAGWTTLGRTYAFFDPQYVIDHHTAGTVDIDRLLQEGRPDVPGPLSQWGHHLDGLLVAIAAGLSNHTGVATISNPMAYGIEATGPKPTGATGPSAFPQYPEYAAVNAAHRIHYGWGPDRQRAHKEIAEPPGRKIDPVFAMDAFRALTDQFISEGGIDEMITENDKPILTAAAKAGAKAAVAELLGLSGPAARMATIQFGQVNNDRAFEILAAHANAIRAALGTLDEEIAADVLAQLPDGGQGPTTPAMLAEAMALVLARGTDALKPPPA